MATKEKLDLYKMHKAEYAASRKPGLVEMSEAKYLAIAGKGEPGGEEFTEKLGALYGMAYTVKMTSKAAGRDYKISPLEGLWWAEGGDFVNTPKADWSWRLLIRTPDFVGEEDLKEAADALQKKGKSPLVLDVALAMMKEGRCVQMLHVGPYDQEDKTIGEMSEYVTRQGLALHGAHHEIYLSDPRRVAPDRLRTVLRHPVR